MRDQILTLTKKLIGFPSTDDNPEAIEDCIGSIADELSDFNVIFMRKNNVQSLLITNTRSSDPKQHFKYILNGHIDVVTADEKLFHPVEKNGRLYGRGSADMKGSVAAMIMAFKMVANQVEYPLAMQIVADEEVGGFDGTLHQLESGVSADFVIVGEKTNFNFGVAAKGLMRLELETTGTAAHGAYLWKGENALIKMVKNITSIQKIFPIPNKKVWESTCNVSIINAGNSVNQVPDKCTCAIDVRVVPEDSAEQIVEKIKSSCSNDTKITVNMNESALFLDPEIGEVKRLRKIAAEITGNKIKDIKEHGGSDARHFMSKNIPALSFGPVGGGLHAKDEWVDIESLETYAQILETFLTE